MTNGNGVYSSYYYAFRLPNIRESPTDMEVVVGINDCEAPTPSTMHSWATFSTLLSPGQRRERFGQYLRQPAAVIHKQAPAIRKPCSTDVNGAATKPSVRPSALLPMAPRPSMRPCRYNLADATVATTSTLTSSSPTVTYGTTVTFTDSITASTGATAPTLGSVDFFDTTTHTDLTPGGVSTGSTNGTVTTVSFTTGVEDA